MNELKPVGKNKKKAPGLFGRKKIVFIFLLAIVIFALGWVGSVSDSGVVSFVLGRDQSLQEENGKINVLLLGIAGGSHDGPNLTDTIMVASYDLQSHSVNLISLPRDLWLDEQKAKVNTLYQTGLSRGEGLKFARQEIGKILGVNIPYAVRVDFAGFVKAVDLVGGLDIDVARSFDDYVYPIPGKEDELCGYQEQEMELNEEKGKEVGLAPGKYKALLAPDGKIATASADMQKGLTYTDQQVVDLFPCRFEHLSYAKGLTKMDGETALKFVRSRHGNNGEGTDFARSKRQQLVLEALKGKILSVETLMDPGKVIELTRTFGKSFDSDISQSDYVEFIKIAKNIKGVKSFVIDASGDDPLLITPRAGIYGAWVLIPPDNDFTKIHRFVNAVLTDNPIASTSSQKR